MTNFVCVLKSPLEVIFQEYIVIGPTKTGIFRQLLEAVNLASYILQKLNQLERHSFPALSTFHRQIEPTLPGNTTFFKNCITSTKQLTLHLIYVHSLIQSLYSLEISERE